MLRSPKRKMSPNPRKLRPMDGNIGTAINAGSASVLAVSKASPMCPVIKT